MKKPRTASTTLLALLILFFPVFAPCADSAEPPEEIRLQTEPVKGFGGFSPMSGLLSVVQESNPWSASYPKVESIPDELSEFDVSVMYVTHDFIQHAWQSKKSGVMDSAHVRNAIDTWGVHPDRLSDRQLDVLTVLLAWEDEQGDAYVMYSQTPPYNFDDAEKHKVPAHLMQDSETPPLALPVSFEVFRDGEVHRINSYLRLSIPSDFSHPGVDGLVFFQGYYQHHIATAQVAGAVYEAALHNNFMLGYFGEEHDYVQVRKPGGEWSAPAGPGQFVHFGDHAYQFISAATDGSEIVLSHAPDFDSQRGTQPGMRAPAFEQESITGDLISLDEETGKWVFLDFWGTWCGPCIAEMPYLIEAWRLFGGDEFVMIGIANDDMETLELFVDEWGLEWPQLISHGSESTELNELYGIRAWPTTFLLDTDGMIQPGSMRGFTLERKLARELGFSAERTEKLLEGNLKIEIPHSLIAEKLEDDEETENIRVDVQGDGIPFGNRVPLYLIDNSYVRALNFETEKDGTGAELRIFINGEQADLPLPGRIEGENGDIRYSFTIDE